jgi:hypothetical protein
VQPLTHASARAPLSEFEPGQLKPGRKEILDYRIADAPDGTSWGLSILAVRGVEEGPVLLVNGGTHGDEYEGPATIQALFESLEPARLKGTWLGVPVLNEPAMSVPQRTGRFDNQDLARTFPGKPGGTVTEQIADGFGAHVLKWAHYYVDLHSAGSIFRMVFLSGYGVVADAKVLRQQRMMAIAFGGELVWGTPLFPGRTLSQAEALGIPAIYTETTGTGGLRKQDVEQYQQGTLNVMRSIGMLEGSYPTQPVRLFRETSERGQHEGYLQVDHPSPCKGLFWPFVDLWDEVKKGQEVGVIVDAAGRKLASVEARRAGHVILVRHWLSVDQDDGLLVVVEGLSEKP